MDYKLLRLVKVDISASASELSFCPTMFAGIMMLYPIHVMYHVVASVAMSIYLIV